jgi:hypothetical protein
MDLKITPLGQGLGVGRQGRRLIVGVHKLAPQFLPGRGQIPTRNQFKQAVELLGPPDPVALHVPFPTPDMRHPLGFVEAFHALAQGQLGLPAIRHI